MQVASTAKCLFTDIVYIYRLQFTALCPVGSEKRKWKRITRMGVYKRSTNVWFSSIFEAGLKINELIQVFEALSKLD